MATGGRRLVPHALLTVLQLCVPSMMDDVTAARWDTLVTTAASYVAAIVRKARAISTRPGVTFVCLGIMEQHVISYVRTVCMGSVIVGWADANADVWMVTMQSFVTNRVAKDVNIGVIT